jgi:hypothetical protein
MNDYQKRILRELMGADFVIQPDFDFKRDILDALDRARLNFAIKHFSYESGWQSLVAWRLLDSDPTAEELLAVAGCEDIAVRRAARDRLLDNDPSDDALDHIVLAGSSTKTQKQRAAEMILARHPPNSTLLDHVFFSFQKGPLVRRAWELRKAAEISRYDLSTRILRYITDAPVLNEAWEMLLAAGPEIGDISFVMTFCENRTFKSKAGAYLLDLGIEDVEQLGSIVMHCDRKAVRETAAAKLLKLRAKSEQFGDIAQHVADPTLAGEGWKRFKKGKFTARNDERLCSLRNLLCFSKHANIRAEALEIAKTVPFSEYDREWIAKYAQDAEARAAFSEK